MKLVSLYLVLLLTVQQQIQPQIQFQEARPSILPPNLQQTPILVSFPQSQNTQIIVQTAQPVQKSKNKNIAPLIKNKFYCGAGNKMIPIPFYDGHKREKPVRTIYGFNMFVDAVDRTVSDRIASSGTWEDGYVSLIGHLVKEGDRVLNLGSQTGLEALVMGKIIGEKGKLFIFEPYSFSYELVSKNIQLNGLKDITTIYKVGASDTKGKATINIPYNNTGASQIAFPTQNNNKNPEAGQFGYYNQTQEVQLDTVDNLLPQDTILDFALLDVEKMQTKALKGMKNIITRSPNLIIMTQWQYAKNSQGNQQQTLDILRFLFDRGYRAYYYEPSWHFCQIGAFSPFYTPEEFLKIGFSDVFFFPRHVPLPQ